MKVPSRQMNGWMDDEAYKTETIDRGLYSCCVTRDRHELAYQSRSDFSLAILSPGSPGNTHRPQLGLSALALLVMVAYDMRGRRNAYC